MPARAVSVPKIGSSRPAPPPGGAPDSRHPHAPPKGGHVEPAPKRDLRNTSPEVRGGWRLTNRRQIKPDPGPLWPTLKRGMGEPRAARFVGCRFEGSWLPYPASKILPETWVGGAGKRPRDGPPCRKSAKYSLHVSQPWKLLTRAHSTGCRLPGSPESQLRGGADPGRSRKRGSHDIQHDGDPCHPAGGRGISSPHQHRHVVTRGGSLTDSCEPDTRRTHREPVGLIS